MDNLGIVGPSYDADLELRTRKGLFFINHLIFWGRIHYEIFASIINSVKTDDNMWASFVYGEFGNSIIFKNVEYSRDNFILQECDYISNSTNVIIKQGIEKLKSYMAENN